MDLQPPEIYGESSLLAHHGLDRLESSLLEFNRFDVSTKELVWDDPASWLERFGLEPRGRVAVIDSDITTLSAAADKVIRVDDPDPYLVNIEFQSSHDLGLTRTLWFRQVALDYRHGLPVLTVLVLLRREANSPSLTGVYEWQLPDGRPTNRYHYQVVRLWREPAESFLTASVGLVPLAPLADVTESELPEVGRRMADRINREPSPRAAKLWTATYLLMGLRYPDGLADQILEGVQAMHASAGHEAVRDARPRNSRDPGGDRRHRPPGGAGRAADGAGGPRLVHPAASPVESPQPVADRLPALYDPPWDNIVPAAHLVAPSEITAMSAVDSSYFDVEESGVVAIARMTVSTIRHPPQAEQLSADLVDLLESYKRTRIVVNLKGTHYLGSSAFAALFGLAKRLDAKGGKLALCEMDPDLLTGAKILGLGSIVPIVPTEAEAVAVVSA